VNIVLILAVHRMLTWWGPCGDGQLDAVVDERVDAHHGVEEPVRERQRAGVGVDRKHGVADAGVPDPAQHSVNHRELAPPLTPASTHSGVIGRRAREALMRQRVVRRHCGHPHTDDLYANYLARFVGPGGQIGIAGGVSTGSAETPAP
jgi:hypothetical protein